MKNYIILLIATLTGFTVAAQNELYNDGSVLYISTGATVQVNGSFTNTNTSSFANYGTVTITGNTTNNQTMSGYTGKLVFNNTSAQQLNGSASLLTKDFEINNAAGAILNTKLIADGVCTFTNGIITASNTAAPFVFTANATVSGVSNASHVNGYVVKEGTGNFTYPVGDAANYQPIGINTSANAGGIRVQYIAADAGTAPFTGATPLLYYNTKEYWDITPISTATGTVTIYWDSYNNIGIGNTADLRVAHLTGGNWVNEGVIPPPAGTTSAGSVTSSATISTWSPFTLGSVSISSTLPLSWLSVTAFSNTQKQVEINWKVNEQNVRTYTIEKSNNGTGFRTIAALNSMGNGINSYTYTDKELLQNTAYYRIKQTDEDGRFSYSSIIKISGQINTGLTIYPMPFKESFTVISDERQTAKLTSLDGKLIKTIQLKAGSNYVNVGGLVKGVYLLVTQNNIVKKVIKE